MPFKVTYFPDNLTSPWKKAHDAVASVLSNESIWPFCLFVALTGSSGITVAVGLLLLLFFSVAFYHSIGEMRGFNAGLSRLIGVAISLGGITLAGYLLWLGIPWLITGVLDWWGWLGGHFK